jgi:uncharacterized protein GlcG (DUF336 family)
LRATNASVKPNLKDKRLKMTILTLEKANQIIQAALKTARQLDLAPLTVAVLC